MGSKGKRLKRTIPATRPTAPAALDTSGCGTGGSNVTDGTEATSGNGTSGEAST